MTQLILRVSGLHAGYGKAEVLHGLDLQAAPGSIITVDLRDGTPRLTSRRGSLD